VNRPARQLVKHRRDAQAERLQGPRAPRRRHLRPPPRAVRCRAAAHPIPQQQPQHRRLGAQPWRRQYNVRFTCRASKILTRRCDGSPSGRPRGYASSTWLRCSQRSPRRWLPDSAAHHRAGRRLLHRLCLRTRSTCSTRERTPPPRSRSATVAGHSLGVSRQRPDECVTSDRGFPQRQGSVTSRRSRRTSYSCLSRSPPT
jgi:hypothetical protein